MKLIVRTFVIALALTGIIASTHANASSAAPASAKLGKTSALPTPVCDPDDPNACGIVGW